MSDQQQGFPPEGDEESVTTRAEAHDKPIAEGEPSTDEALAKGDDRESIDMTDLSLEESAPIREKAYIKAAIKYHLKRIEHQLSAVLEIGQTLSSTLDPEQILTLLMEKVTELMEADRSTLFLVDHKNGEIWSKILQGDGEQERIRLAFGQGIAGWVAQTGETVNITDAYNDPRFNSSFDRETGYQTRTVLTMPLRNQRGEIVGVIQVLNKHGDQPFREEDEQLLHAIAAQAATFLENARLYQELWQKHVQVMRTSRQLEQRTYELDIVYDIEQQMSSAFNPDEMLNGILTRVVNLLDCSASVLALQDPRTKRIYTRAATGTRAPSTSSLQMGQGFIGWTMQQGEPLLTNEPVLDPRYKPNVLDPNQALHSVLCVPLEREDRLLGALCLLNKRGPKGFTADDLRIVRQIGAQISRAVEIGERRKQKLQENRLATIGQLMSGVLHDLKGPMTIISGYSQMLAQQDDPQKRAKFSDQIMNQIEHLNRMTREVLAFARGESTMLVRKINMNQFASEIANHLTQEFEGSGITLHIENNYRGHAYVDESKLQRLIYNLARNARQAMGDTIGGRFEVEIYRDEEDKLHILCKDNGPGIPEAIKSRIFDSFVTGRPKEGSGLGLAIVRKIVDEHQGEIRFTTETDKGTTFHVILPINGPQTNDEAAA